MSRKVLIADKVPEWFLGRLCEAGLEVSFQPKLGEAELPTAVDGIEVLVVRSTKVSAAAIEAASKLALIVRAGSGYNTIAVDAATAHRVAVSNCPGKNAVAVAELAMGLLLTLDRRIPDNVSDFRSGTWNKAEYSKAEGLYGKTLGILGMGNIGKEVARRARAFGMKVCAYDVVTVNEPGVEMLKSVEAVVVAADALTVHLPAGPTTKGLFNTAMFDRMKPGMLFINTSRHDVVDEAALLAAVEKKGLRAAVDVFKGEPEQKNGAVTSPLANCRGIYVTHHIGASTEQAQNAVAEEALRIILTWYREGTVPNRVN